MKNKTMKEHQIYQDTRWNTFCPACKLYCYKIHKCSGISWFGQRNTWLNIDTHANIVIMGIEAQDVKCMDDSERNDNTVNYYKNRNEMYDDLKDKASKKQQQLNWWFNQTEK